MLTLPYSLYGSFSARASLSIYSLPGYPLVIKESKQATRELSNQKRPSTSKKATPAQISSYRLGDFIHEVFDKENASEKDADFD